MAATLSSVSRESVGSTTMHIWKFSSIATADTYDTKLSTAIVGYWMTVTSGYAAGTSGSAFQLSESSGTLTFTAPAGVEQAAIAATVYTLSQS